MRQHDTGIIPLIVVAFAILFVVSWCHVPSDASFMEPNIQEEMTADLPMMVLGEKEALMMKNHLMDTGKEAQGKGYWYYIRTYDAGRAQPPGMDEYYQLKVHMIYVPEIAKGFNIGLEYVLEEGKTDKWGNSEIRKIIQYHLDDGDEDLIPNSMLRVEMETRYGTPVKREIKPVKAMSEWRYWVYFWYSTFLKEGMK